MGSLTCFLNELKIILVLYWSERLEELESPVCMKFLKRNSFIRGIYKKIYCVLKMVRPTDLVKKERRRRRKEREKPFLDNLLR